MAPAGGVMVAMNRMNRILELDFPNRCAVVQPGLINLWLSEATREHGYYFAPDPSSQMVSSIGGNCSTNAGGPHCLKYGITVNHVLGLQAVTGAGELVWLGGKVQDRPGYDLTGGVVGSRGDARARDRGHRPAPARARGREDAARVLRRARRRLGDGVGDHRRGHRAVGARDHRRVLRARHRGRHRRRLSQGRGGRAPDRAGRAARGGRGAGLPHRADLPRSRRARDPRRAGRGRARAPVEGTQGGRRRRRPHDEQLAAPGRRGAAVEAARDHARDAGHRRAPRPPDRQRLSRRRRQPPPDDPLRRSGARRDASAPRRSTRSCWRRACASAAA